MILRSNRSNREKEDRPMRVLAWLGLALAFMVLVFGFVHIAEAYLFILLSVAVLLIGASLVTGR